MSIKNIEKCKNESIPCQINQLKLLILKSFNRILKKSAIDLTSEQMHLLSILLEKDEFFMNELSTEIMVDNSAITRLVDTLEKKGYVKRKISKQDRRLRLISITNSGRNEICRAKELASMHHKTLTNNINTEELRHFKEVLHIMKNNMEDSFSDDNSNAPKA